MHAQCPFKTCMNFLIQNTRTPWTRMLLLNRVTQISRKYLFAHDAIVTEL